MKALTLADLIHNFLADPKIPKRRKSMTKSSCRHALKALGYDTNSDFPVHKIHSAQKALSTYLETTQLSPRSRTNYQSYFRRFVNWCEYNHLLPRKLQNKLTLEWLDLTHPLKGVSSGRKGWRGALRKLGYWATGFGIQPADLTHEHLRAYVDFLKNESGVCAWPQIYHRTRKEWNHHAMEGLVHELVWPILPSSVRSTYAIKIEKWPREMQEEYKIYRAWCTDDFRLKRPLRYKHRESTAKQNLEMMQRIAGYTHYTCGLPLRDLDMTLFFDQALISGYMQWLVTDRNNGRKPEQLKGIITQLLGMANGYFERLDATE